MCAPSNARFFLWALSRVCPQNGLTIGLAVAVLHAHSCVHSIGGSRIFLEGEGVTLGTRASEASEHWGDLGLRENEIWAFVS